MYIMFSKGFQASVSNEELSLVSCQYLYCGRSYCQSTLCLSDKYVDRRIYYYYKMTGLCARRKDEQVVVTAFRNTET